MNTKRYLLGSLVVFIFVFLFEWIFHGIVLNDRYAALPNMMRTEDAMQALFVWMVIGYVVLALAFSYIFVRGYEGRGIGEGFRFGFWIGLLVAVPTNLIIYAVQPWPGELVVWWIVGGFIEVILAGVLLASVYRPAEASTG